MSAPFSAAFFDVDGVLVDSLPQHLRICQDKAAEFSLDLQIPSVEEFRRWVSRGVRISPMKFFFLAVGFPEEYAERAVLDYEREFAHKYRPKLFDGALEMLEVLRKEGMRLGLVTSNTRANVLAALGPAVSHFEPSCLFFFDPAAPTSKASLLRLGAQQIGMRPSDCSYVGDQPADADAAHEAGFRFLGVTYGWGIIQGDTRFDTVSSVGAIADRLLTVARSMS